MTRVDFYIVGDASDRARAMIACRLAAKAFSRDMRIHIHTPSSDDAAQVDQLLWTFRDGSFVPHLLADDPLVRETAADNSVIIGHGHEPSERCELLINLAPDVPRFFSRVTRVAEVIDAHPDRRAAGRERFKFYRDRGYPVETHNL